MRTASAVFLLLGAAGSVLLMLIAGRRIGSPPYLLLMFAQWVLSPFALLAIAVWRSRWWSLFTRKALYVVAMAMTPTTLAIYAAVAFGAAKPRPPVFVVLPPVAWLVTVLAVGAASTSQRGRRPS